jgi:hypothetical protein
VGSEKRPGAAGAVRANALMADGRGSSDVNVQDQIDNYIASQDLSKRDEMEELHRLILKASPNCKLWFLDGRNNERKIVSNENIGYGSLTLNYADGSLKEFYRIGMSANKTGISMYFMGLTDRKHLPETYGHRIGKATITGYCVRFRHLKEVNVDVLEEMIANHMGKGTPGGS